MEVEPPLQRRWSVLQQNEGGMCPQQGYYMRTGSLPMSASSSRSWTPWTPREKRKGIKSAMSCLHDHDCADHSCAAHWSLHEHIELDGVSALNESVIGSLKSVFKSWDRRLDTSEGLLESIDGDPELLVFIPFTSHVKIKSISIVGGSGGKSLSKMRVFINRVGIDFSDVQNMQPVQEWNLTENLQGILEYQTRYSRFQSVVNLILHFLDNFGGETTQIYYIGLKGEPTQLRRDVVATTVYEVMPNPTDHKSCLMLQSMPNTSFKLEVAEPVEETAAVLIPADVLSNLADEVYTNQKNATSKIEGIIDQFELAQEHDKISSVINQLPLEFTSSP